MPWSRAANFPLGKSLDALMESVQGGAATPPSTDDIPFWPRNHGCQPDPTEEWKHDNSAQVLAHAGPREIVPTERTTPGRGTLGGHHHRQRPRPVFVSDLERQDPPGQRRCVPTPRLPTDELIEQSLSKFISPEETRESRQRCVR